MWLRFLSQKNTKAMMINGTPTPTPAPIPAVADLDKRLDVFGLLVAAADTVDDVEDDDVEVVALAGVVVDEGPEVTAG